MQPPRQSRKEARAKRSHLKAISEQEGKVRLIARLSDESDNIPRVAGVPPPSEQEPRIEQDPTIIWSMKMTWCISEKDVAGAWSWREQRQWTDEEFDAHIKYTLDLLTNSTWHEIHQMRSGGLQNHHSQEVASIIDEAQQRWAEIGMATDEAFRFRLTGKQRAWGYREGSHFKMVWYDRHHKIYPVEKKNS